MPSKTIYWKDTSLACWKHAGVGLSADEWQLQGESASKRGFTYRKNGTIWALTPEGKAVWEAWQAEAHEEDEEALEENIRTTLSLEIDKLKAQIRGLLDRCARYDKILAPALERLLIETPKE